MENSATPQTTWIARIGAGMFALGILLIVVTSYWQQALLLAGMGLLLRVQWSRLGGRSAWLDFRAVAPLLIAVMLLGIGVFGPGFFFIYLLLLFVGGCGAALYDAATKPSRQPDVRRHHRRGADIMSADEYRADYEERFPPAMPPAPRLADLPYPPGGERMHTSISASTGAGKTTALRGLLASIRARGDRALVLDNNSEFLNEFRQPDDLVIAPFANDGPGWRLSNEARHLHDWDRLSEAFVPQGTGNSVEWHGMAKALFGAAGAGLAEVYDGSFSNAEFQRVLVSADARELAPLLAGTTAEVLASDDESNSRRLQSVRMSFIDHLKAWRYVRDGDFSFRDWVAVDSPQWMFLPYSDDDLRNARDLLAAWVDIVVTSALQRPPGTPAPSRTTWIVVDELNSLGEISALLVAATRLRKAGVAIVVAVQDYAQLRETYGDNRAETLMNNFSNKLILRTTEANAAEYLSKQIGEREMLEESASVSFGQGGPGTSYSQSIVNERVVMASEIQKLPDLEGFMNFAGDWPVIKVRVPLPEPFAAPTVPQTTKAAPRSSSAKTEPWSPPYEDDAAQPAIEEPLKTSDAPDRKRRSKKAATVDERD